MKAAKIPQVESAETPISSMIDIVFLLIIFFVVTADVDKEVEDEKVILSEAPHGKTVKKKDPRSVVINVHQDGVMRMGMFDVTAAEIKKTIDAAKVQYGTDFPIILRGDYNAQHGYIKKAMDAVTSTGLYTIKINAQKGE